MESSNQEIQYHREKTCGESLILFLDEVAPECGKNQVESVGEANIVNKAKRCVV